MRVLKKTFATILVICIIVGLFSGAEVRAGGTDEMYIEEYEPVFEVEATQNDTAIEVYIPEQKYYQELSPTGYKIVLELVGAEDEETEKPAVNLYELYGFSSFGYGPYANEDNNLLGQIYDVKEKELSKNGRSFTFRHLEPGIYTVKLYAYATDRYESTTEPGVIYWFTYGSQWFEKTIQLGDIDSVVEKEPLTYDFSKVKKGDIIKFGSYEQDLNLANGDEYIEWIVLSKTKSEMLVISRYTLDKLPFNKTLEPVTWENCTLRHWLNESFYEYAFNSTEQSMIKTATLKNPANPSTGVSAGKKTKDKVFILSLDEVTNSSYGFSKKKLTYDKNRMTSFSWSPYSGGRWWLRTPADDQMHYLFVGSEGSLEYEHGAKVYANWSNPCLGVRPAMYIKLK